MKANIDGTICECKVTENLGYNHDVGMYCKAVEIGGRERIIVKAPDGWRTWGRNNENIGIMGNPTGQTVGGNEMRIIIDMPDMPEAAKDTALDWVKELIENSPIKKHVKAIEIEKKPVWNLDIPKCKCGGKVMLVKEKYRCDCGKVFSKI